MAGNENLEHDTAEDATQIQTAVPMHTEPEPDDNVWFRWDNPALWEGDDDDDD